jgi:hypothetical protein
VADLLDRVIVIVRHDTGPPAILRLVGAPLRAA